MRDLLFIACGAGLHDGLNPCVFMACAVFIVQGLWLSARSLRTDWLRFVFVLIYAISDLAFNFGPGQAVILNRHFIFAAKILYFVLGAWTFVLGILFFNEWILLRRGSLVEDWAGKKIKFLSLNGIVVCLTTVILGIVLSALATLWPVDKYIIILCNMAIIKGQWQSVMPLMVGYVLVSMWPLWFVWAFLGIKNLRPSMLKIVCASIFFTASSCMILMFK